MTKSLIGLNVETVQVRFTLEGEGLEAQIFFFVMDENFTLISTIR